jgi:hypothetical protein
VDGLELAVRKVGGQLELPLNAFGLLGDEPPALELNRQAEDVLAAGIDDLAELIGDENGRGGQSGAARNQCGGGSERTSLSCESDWTTTSIAVWMIVLNVASASAILFFLTRL